VLIGKNILEQLDIMPAMFCVIITHLLKYTFKNKDDIVQAPTLVYIIEASILMEALLVQITISKYANGLLLYQQEAIYTCSKVKLDHKLIVQ